MHQKVQGFAKAYKDYNIDAEGNSAEGKAELRTVYDNNKAQYFKEFDKFALFTKVVGSRNEVNLKKDLVFKASAELKELRALVRQLEKKAAEAAELTPGGAGKRKRPELVRKDTQKVSPQPLYHLPTHQAHPPSLPLHP
jgi:hypothetical protein